MSNKDKLLELAGKDVDILRRLAQVSNSWDGSLEEFDVQEFDDEFFNTYFEGKPMEAVRAWHFGGDDNNWSDEYIRFNGYGNLETLSEWQLEKELEDSAEYIIDTALAIEDDYVQDEIKEILAENEDEE